MIFETVCSIFGDLFERVAKFFVGKRIAIGKKIAEIVKYLLDGFYVAFVAVNEQLIAACADVHIEQRFKIFNILILNAKKRVETLWRKFEFS